MKRSIIALGLAALAVASFAEDQHRFIVLKSDQQSVAMQQVADAEEWLRSRPGAQDSNRDATS